MIKKEDLREEIKKGMQETPIIDGAFKMLRTEWEPSESNIKKLADTNRMLAEARGEAVGDPEQEARAIITGLYESIERTEQFIKADRATYKKVLEYMAEGDELGKDTAKKINGLQVPFFAILWQFFTFAFNVIMRSSSGIDPAALDAVAVSTVINGSELNTEADSPTVKALKAAGEDLDAWAEIADLYTEIRERILNGDDLIIKHQNRAEIIPRHIYDDEMIITQSEYINSLVKNGLVLNESVFKKSEEILNGLKPEDRDILDLLIFGYYAHGSRRFTDRMIATDLYYGGNNDADVKAENLQKINDSIERLRRTEIKQGVESLDDIDEAKFKLTERPMLISVIPKDIEHKGKTTVYDFTGEQGFYEYAQLTAKTSKYSNLLITTQIKGVEHNFKNDNLRRLITRRITGLQFSKQTAIDMTEIYKILEITDNRKSSTVREKLEKIIKELKKTYNFNYEIKRRGRKMIKVIFTADTQNPLKKQPIEQEN